MSCIIIIRYTVHEALSISKGSRAKNPTIVNAENTKIQEGKKQVMNRKVF